MATNISDLLDSLNNRIEEVEIILLEAESIFEIPDKEKFYNALCRSAQVMISAHFEGFLKELTKNILEDINTYSCFNDVNESLKRKVCEHLLSFESKKEGKTEKAHIKIQELIEIFNENGLKFKPEYLSTYYQNNNPKESILNKTAEQFGVKKIFEQLGKSQKLDIIFSGELEEIIEIRNDLRKYLLENTENYPYTIDIVYLECTKVESEELWSTFLDNFLKRRHDIVHGREISNSTGYAEINNDFIKIEILIYCFSLFVLDKIKPALIIN